jgi:hypothetical protein
MFLGQAIKSFFRVLVGGHSEDQPADKTLDSASSIDLTDTQIDQSLEIYKYADTIMHSRIQSFLLTQTFLILAYATALAPILSNSEAMRLEGRFFLCLVSVVGISTAWLQRSKMLSIHLKISALMPIIEERNAVFKLYITGYRSADSNRFAFTSTTPIVIIFAWVLLIFLAVHLGSPSSGCSNFCPSAQ